MIYTTPDIRPIHSYRIHTSEATFLNWMGVDKKYKSVMHKAESKKGLWHFQICQGSAYVFCHI